MAAEITINYGTYVLAWKGSATSTIIVLKAFANVVLNDARLIGIDDGIHEWRRINLIVAKEALRAARDSEKDARKYASQAAGSKRGRKAIRQHLREYSESVLDKEIYPEIGDRNLARLGTWADKRADLILRRRDKMVIRTKRGHPTSNSKSFEMACNIHALRVDVDKPMETRKALQQTATEYNFNCNHIRHLERIYARFKPYFDNGEPPPVEQVFD